MRSDLLPAVREAATIVRQQQILIIRTGHPGVLAPTMGVTYTAIGQDGIELAKARGYWRLRFGLKLRFGRQIQVPMQVVDVEPRQPGWLWPRNQGCQKKIQIEQGELS